MYPFQYGPIKGGMNLVPTERNNLAPMRIVTVWRICMVYRRLNSWTINDHFPMTFMDHMYDILVGKD